MELVIGNRVKQRGCAEIDAGISFLEHLVNDTVRKEGLAGSHRTRKADIGIACAKKICKISGLGNGLFKIPGSFSYLKVVTKRFEIFQSELFFDAALFVNAVKNGLLKAVAACTVDKSGILAIRAGINSSSISL